MKKSKTGIIFASFVTLLISVDMLLDIRNGFISHRGTITSMDSEAPMFWFIIGFKVVMLFFMWIVTLDKIKT